jgi:hypothetical protein
MLPYGLALVVSPPSLFINAGLSIPVLGVAEGFFTSTIYKGEGVLGLFLALLNVFILHALLLSHAYCCRAHCWVGGGVELRLCWLFAIAHVRSTARPISDAAAGGAGDEGDGFEERIVSA